MVKWCQFLHIINIKAFLMMCNFAQSQDYSVKFTNVIYFEKNIICVISLVAIITLKKYFYFLICYLLLIPKTNFYHIYHIFFNEMNVDTCFGFEYVLFIHVSFCWNRWTNVCFSELVVFRPKHSRMTSRKARFKL